MLTAPEKLQEFRDTDWIERKAQRIDDPIARLKYLRKATTIPVEPKRRKWIPVVPFCLAALFLTLRSDAHLRRLPEIPRVSVTADPFKQELPNVWRVEATKDYEVFSNGLRIEDDMAVANTPRSYRLVSVEEVMRPEHLALNPNLAIRPPAAPKTNQKPGAEGNAPNADDGLLPHMRRTQPTGIVFHTTESDQVPFQQDQQRNLQRITRDTLLFVRYHRAYHFLIDKFGRVHRIVAESDAANHAGNSIWADSRWLYLELNQSFLGVAFEASMQTDQNPITPAQLNAAKVLTEMLRSKYNIPAENCVTHAQVSVNPDNKHVGWHADWGKGFPFHEVGLPNNYERPLPSIYLMGFGYDAVYRNATGPGIWKGLDVAEERLREGAEARRMTVAGYRTLLQKRYSDEIRALRQWGADEEN